jgi:hypothetical protein
MVSSNAPRRSTIQDTSVRLSVSSCRSEEQTHLSLGNAKARVPRAPHDQRAQSAYLFGALCPNVEPPSCRWISLEQGRAHLGVSTSPAAEKSWPRLEGDQFPESRPARSINGVEVHSIGLKAATPLQYRSKRNLTAHYHHCLRKLRQPSADPRVHC